MSKSKIVNIKSAKEAHKKQRHAKSLKLGKKKKPVRHLSPEEKKKEFNQLIIKVLVVVLLLAVGGYSVYKIGVLKMDKYRLNDVNIDLRREKAMLEEELKNVQNLEYVEEEAREKLNLILPGEVIYKFSDDSDVKKDK